MLLKTLIVIFSLPIMVLAGHNQYESFALVPAYNKSQNIRVLGFDFTEMITPQNASYFLMIMDQNTQELIPYHLEALSLKQIKEVYDSIVGKGNPYSLVMFIAAISALNMHEIVMKVINNNQIINLGEINCLSVALLAGSFLLNQLDKEYAFCRFLNPNESFSWVKTSKSSQLMENLDLILYRLKEEIPETTKRFSN